MKTDAAKKATLLQHLGEETKYSGAVAPPIFQNSLFLFNCVEEMRQEGKGDLGSNRFYSRVGNPSLEVVEKKLAMLEGTEHCRLVGSGMSAISSVLLANASAGSNIVTIDSVYGPVKEVLTNYFPKFGVTSTFVDGTCVDEVIDSITPETTLVYLESPTSLTFRLQDLRAIAKACKEKGVKTAIDNTYATPFFQNPAELGIDYVIHSCTKYIGGHSDVVAGAICCSKENLKPIIHQEISHFVSALAPFNGWLLNRGLRTLKLRINHHEAAGNAVAGWLEDQSWVERVHHISLPSFPQKDLFRAQMKGSGGLFAFEPKVQDAKRVEGFIDDLKYFGIGVSWGGFESLALTMPVNLQAWKEPRQLVRVFVGLEDTEDLIADLAAAADKNLIG